ncbi:MAG: hypothetical protein ABL986_13960 [Vicinamibacterales bacterium]
MKVVLSRKGFDSKFGGVPSPVLPDGRMISLCIPDKDAPVAYDVIHRDEIKVSRLVEDLTRGRIPPHYRAHLDPDLDRHAVERPPGWRPIFGQSGAALGHLHKQGVGPGDLFLFFGWFRAAESLGGRWRYVPGSAPVHAVWGWMLIGAVHSCGSPPPDVSAWAASHPHLSGAHPKDEVFVAANELHINGKNLPGAGLFTSRPERILTAPGGTRSNWRLPAWMHPDAGHATLSCHGDPRRWSSIDSDACGLRSAPIGQEFVLNTTRQDIIEGWLEGVFADVKISEGPKA